MNYQATEKDWAYCREMLPKVSRTFALNIGQLRGNMFKAVLLGYLLFRMADTLEDNLYQKEREKIEDLQDFSLIFKGNKGLDQRIRLYEHLRFRWKEDSDEKNLIENGCTILRCYFDVPEIYRGIIDPLLVETSQGMAEFQKRKLESDSAVFQLADIEELEDYCYYVAGVVGVMLTEVFCQHEGIRKKKAGLESCQIHFGLALQMINVIKDYRKDIARGWCYIPSTVTQSYSIDVGKMDSLSLYQRQGIVNEMMPRVVRYLDSTLKYIQVLPLHVRSVRKFCIIPFVIGYRTLAKIGVLEGTRISREEVASIMKEANVYADSNHALEKDYLSIRSRLLGRC